MSPVLIIQITIFRITVTPFRLQVRAVDTQVMSVVTVVDTRIIGGTLDLVLVDQW